MIDQNVIKHDFFRFFDFDRNGYKNNLKYIRIKKLLYFA